MHADKAALWSEALRSGKYPQGPGALQRDGRFCCLGVACELAVDAGIVVRNEGENGWTYYSPTGDPFSKNEIDLPIVVMEWLGMKTTSGGLPAGHKAYSLIDLNDVEKRDFDYIAAFIDENHAVL